MFSSLLGDTPLAFCSETFKTGSHRARLRGSRAGFLNHLLVVLTLSLEGPADGQGQAWEAAPLGEAQTPFVSARPATPRLAASLVGFRWAQPGVSASFAPA